MLYTTLNDNIWIIIMTLIMTEIYEDVKIYKYVYVSLVVFSM